MEGKTKKRITSALISRTNKYHWEFNKLMSRLYHKIDGEQLRKEFIEVYSDEFPILLNPDVCLRVSARQVFDKHYYTLRNVQFKQEPIPTEQPRGF